PAPRRTLRSSSYLHRNRTTIAFARQTQGRSKWWPSAQDQRSYRFEQIFRCTKGLARAQKIRTTRVLIMKITKQEQWVEKLGSTAEWCLYGARPQRLVS